MGWQETFSFVYNFAMQDKRILILIIVLLLNLVLVLIYFIVKMIIAISRRKKRVYEEISIENREELAKIKKIKNARNVNSALINLGEEIKEFSKKYIEVEPEMTYGDISKNLREKSKFRLADLADDISNHLYSEDRIIKRELIRLADKFKFIVLGRKYPKPVPKVIIKQKKINRKASKQITRRKESRKKLKRSLIKNRKRIKIKRKKKLR